MDGRELLERDRARLEQPSKVGWQIGDGGFHKHPSARFEHLAQTLEYGWIGVRLRCIEQRTEVGVGIDAVPLDQSGRARQQRLFGGIAAHQRERRQLRQRAGQGGADG